MARGRGMLREDDDEQDIVPQLPPSAIVANRPVENDDEAIEDTMREQDLAYLLGEGGVATESEPSDAEELFDEDLLQRCVIPLICDTPKSLLSLISPISL